MPVDFATGKHPGWEREVSDDEQEADCNTVLESCVVLQSLRQSREQWMYHIFPKFSGRGRGKLDASPVPPPHTIQSRGRCQIEIGPHIFTETSFFEVRYLLPGSAASSSIYSWQSPYVTDITPALINQVNAAAAANPTLANLLQLAAAGKASPEQLQTLGLLIQSLSVPESPEALSSAANLMSSLAQPYTPPVAASPPAKDFDLVLQYHETQTERWTIPRGPVICEKVADTRIPDLAYDIILTLALQVPKQPESSAGAADANKPTSQVVSMRLKRPPPALWETIWRWVGGEDKLKENRIILDDLKAVAPQYVMRPIKPGPIIAPRAKRKPAQRKPPQVAANPSATSQASGSAAAASSSTSAPGSSGTTQPDAKRRKVTKQPHNEIRCVSCQQADVPLILGGLLKSGTGFCRPPPQYTYPVQSTAPTAHVSASSFTGYTPSQPPPQPPAVVSNEQQNKVNNNNPN
ncbi:hypothetical protein B0H15DRAFT_975624 [Mycena belliarum]|uniref:Uncharacterized protein n=1 Tax=Mycena belliarum TaxID=1033014 RepID=A0AAD6UHI4_9AGAR|nr:hypothetical protein B0H15DRAFT_975624 [Mycena belliae]